MVEVPDSHVASFAVRTDASSLRRSATGSITGHLFLEIGGDTFPAADWSDFPVVVLGWWNRAVLDLQRTGASCSCMFMDGPFEFGLKRIGPNAWELRLIERRAAAVHVVRSERVSPAEVLLAVHSAADAVLKFCKERSWSSTDVDDLRAARNALGQ
ncbi:MAG: hypothetical protein NDI82_06275 [Anaeromyxobacteraceae bacterium]|nr:hypothetical protein [Anaeromyxobacteraceae bacterium]